MRMLTKLLALSGITGTLVVAAAAPAAATPDPCPGGESICLFTNGGTFPVGNPVAVSPGSVGPAVVPGPRLCDSSGANCTETFLIVPGATFESTGSTVANVTVPPFGIGVDTLTVYFGGVPTVTPTGGGLGITATVHVPLAPVWVRPVYDPFFRCGTPTTTVGPLTYDSTNFCLFRFTITL